MAAPNPRLDRLLVTLLAELGKGRITEAFLPSTKEYHTDAETVGHDITINPAPETVDSVLHELTHRAFPCYPESYVRGCVTQLMKYLSDEQVQAIFAQYQKIKKCRKRARPVEES